jgi:hypothetical protein
MIKHTKSKLVFPTAALCTGKLWIFMGVVVYCPYRKKCHQELANDHYDDVINEKTNIEIKYQACKNSY